MGTPPHIEGAIVFGAGDAILARRTMRSLARANVTAKDMTGATAGELAQAVTATSKVWLVRAGAWRATAGAFEPPPSSATGLPVFRLLSSAFGVRN